MKANKIAATRWLRYRSGIEDYRNWANALGFCASDFRKVFCIKDSPQSVRLEAYDKPRPGAIEMQLKYDPEDLSCPAFEVRRGRRGRRGVWHALYRETNSWLLRLPAFRDMEVGEKKTIYVVLHTSKKQI